MPSEEIDLTGTVQRRLHPISLVFHLAGAVRSLIIPAVVLMFATSSRERPYSIWMIYLFVSSSLYAIARYLSYRYHYSETELIVQEGILNRRMRVIPFDRIHNIDTTENPFHRLLGVARVRIETAAVGSEPEADISVLSRAAVEDLRQIVFAGRSAAGASPDRPDSEQDEVVLKVPPSELAMLGLISSRGMVVVAALLGLLSQTGIFESDAGGNMVVEMFRTRGTSSPGSTLAVAEILIALFVIWVVAMRLLSVGWYVLNLHGFTLILREHGLRTRFGLATRHAASIPFRRIQRLHVVQTPLARLARRAWVRVETAGGATSSDRGGADKNWIAPIIHASGVGDLLDRVQPGLGLEDAEWLPLAPRAHVRLFFRRVVKVSLVAAGFGLVFSEPKLLLGVPALLPLCWFLARKEAEHTSYCLAEEALLMRRGWLSKRLTCIRYGKVQTVGLTDSYFDRRNSMRTLRVDTAGAIEGSRWGCLALLDSQEAEEAYQAIVTRIEKSDFLW